MSTNTNTTNTVTRPLGRRETAVADLLGWIITVSGASKAEICRRSHRTNSQARARAYRLIDDLIDRGHVRAQVRSNGAYALYATDAGIADYERWERD